MSQSTLRKVAGDGQPGQFPDHETYRASIIAQINNYLSPIPPAQQNLNQTALTLNQQTPAERLYTVRLVNDHRVRDELSRIAAHISVSCF